MLPVMPAIATATGDSTKNASGTKGWNSTFTGTATSTGSGYSGGAVLLDPIPSDAFITALNPTQMNFGGIKAALAGAYLEVTGPKGKTTVYVTDLYPEAASGGLDLSYNAFSAIGNLADGHIPISWKVVRAPITGNVQYRIKEGSSRYWAAIQVRHHIYPVVKFEVKQGSTWTSLPKTDYNHFVGTNLGNKPLSIRVTDIRGKVIADKIPGLPEYGGSRRISSPVTYSFPEVRRRPQNGRYAGALRPRSQNVYRGTTASEQRQRRCAPHRALARSACGTGFWSAMGRDAALGIATASMSAPLADRGFFESSPTASQPAGTTQHSHDLRPPPPTRHLFLTHQGEQTSAQDQRDAHGHRPVQMIMKQQVAEGDGP